MRVFGFAALFAAAIGSIVFLTVLLGDSGNSAADDARAVYCLAPANTSALVRAAAALGLAGADPAAGRVVLANRRLTPAQWRAARPADFDRACAALSAPQFAKNDYGGGNSITTGLTVLVQVGGGALLTLVIDNYRIAAERGRTDAAGLRDAWRSFSQQVADYAKARLDVGPMGIPLFAPVAQQREDVETALRVVATRHPRWGTPRRLADELRTGPLGADLESAGKWPPDDEERPTRKNTFDTVNKSLSDLGGSVLRIADALETTIRLGRRP
ncbi:hypothetical protein KGA66_00645 [Actinocrinis puniceicyclus]|uniref:Uncharacterized protein n=1 Tax=Actinocrinis puniceicyclus TaxID=977794 RepID=A0A8J7WHQ0_9ACTN|nr:hypothetical protein [Actinocrinis puniceicyclus]MBS2961533.1 hypothetical protein [Actinocrinis puniceicyclus]